MCGGGDVIIDVGCDHGYLPCALLGSGAFSRAVLTDVNAKPLDAARATVHAAGFDGVCDFFLTDGLCHVRCGGKYVISVCGMGGELISSIIERSPEIATGAEHLVLQPMSRPEALRSFLLENGFDIMSELCVSEGDKLYVIIKARYDGKARDVDPVDCFLGRAGDMERGEEKYLLRMKDAVSRIRAGKEKAALDADFENTLLCEIARRLGR